MTNRSSLVSIIIPVFNRSEMLCEAVLSVAEQKHHNIEILIVDDGSTDDTPEAISEIKAEYGEIIRSARIPNSGPGAAREAGRSMAQGDFIQYLDSDDLLLPGKISGQLKLLEQYPDCGVAYGKTIFEKVGEPRRWEAYKKTGILHEELFPTMLSGRWWSTSTPLFRRQVCDVAGPWLSLCNEEDWEYDCRIAKLRVRLCYLDEFVSVTRSHDQGHACDDGASDPVKLRDRCEARILISRHALSTGIKPDHPDFSRFLDSSFLVARQAAAAGVQESDQLINELLCINRSMKMRLYKRMAKSFGNIRAARWYEQFHHLTKGAGREHDT